MTSMNSATPGKSHAAGPAVPDSEACGTPAGRRSRTRSSEVERELVTAAEVVLGRDGPGGLTLRAVAMEAGIAQTSVYNRFGSKDGLVDALLVVGFDRLRAVIDAAASGAAVSRAAGGTKPDMLTRLRDCALMYRDFALENSRFYAIMFEDAIPQECHSREVYDHATAVIDALIRLVELTAAAGQIAAPDPAETAQQIWSSVHGAVALELKGLVVTPDPAKTYLAHIDTLLRGLAP
jgi:AcrR family transcriptional regulator